MAEALEATARSLRVPQGTSAVIERSRSAEHQSRKSKNMNTEKYITVKNCNKKELQDMLNDWLAIYIDRLRNNLVFEIAEIRPNVSILKVDKKINDTYFFYMVNYFGFAYPHVNKKKFKAEGFTTAKTHKAIQGQKINVFVNEQDDEHDIWIATERGEVYTFMFELEEVEQEERFKKMNLVRTYNELNISNSAITFEQIHFNKEAFLKDEKKRDEAKDEQRIEKRFRISLIVLFALAPTAYLINEYFLHFEKIAVNLFLSAIISLFLFIDYKILNNIKRFGICVLLSLLNIAWGLLYIADTTTMIFSDKIMITLSLSITITVWTFKKILGAKFEEWYDYSFGVKNDLLIGAMVITSLLMSGLAFQPILRFFL